MTIKPPVRQNSFRTFIACVRFLAVVSVTICLPGPARWLHAQTNPWQSGASGSIYYSGGNVGIGTSTPSAPLHSVGIVAAETGPGSNVMVLLNQSARASGYGTTYGGIWFYANKNLNIEALSGGVAWRHLILNEAGGGYVGIGTTNPQYPLSVNGTVQAKEVLVNTGWSDYVFAPGYRLPKLKDTAAFIRKNGHLPNIPSEAEIKEKGVPVGEMESKLLAKVEELTLHMIQADERNDRLEQRNDRLAQQNRDLQDRLARLEMRIGH